MKKKLRSKEALIKELEELHQQNAELKKMIEEGRLAEEKLKFFAYSISHDLKNPTMIIYGFTKRLGEYYREILDEKGRNYCKQIMDTAKHLMELVENINVYIQTKEMAPKIQDVDVNEVINIIKNEFSAQLNFRRIKWLEPKTAIVIRADRLYLFRVLRNLVDNALRYGGDNLSKIEIGHKSTEKFHILSVSDNGRGINKEDCEKIFGVFQRNKFSEEFEGTGLGLAIVKEIAEKHGGMAWAEPRKDGRTFFYVSLSKDI